MGRLLDLVLVGKKIYICAFHVVKIFILGWLVTIEQYSKSSKKGSKFPFLQAKEIKENENNHATNRLKILTRISGPL